MSADDDEADDPRRGERIAKWLARAGIASRRDAEKLIAEGKVKLNGKPVETPATFVAAGDKVSVEGKPVAAPERTRLFRYHKPDGLVTTHRDPEGRPTVFEKLPAGLPRVVSIGRLDITSEGLLLLTNDGELARRLELPSNGWLRRYRVRVHGAVDERALANLARGITVDGVAYGPIEAGLDSRQGANAWLTISLKEGKNREVRMRGCTSSTPARRRAAEAPAPEAPAAPPVPPPRGRSIPRARNAGPRRPHANRRRPSPRS